MPDNMITGNQIRKSFIDFFVARGHTYVPSSSLVPTGDQTLLFTNSGMVQFKNVFLGTEQRPYRRAANSQKCMRVAGKHNDLDDVGRDNTHHTFFEMLGNWSFGDYYKKEAIAWAWELLTDIWGLPKDRIWATCFEDEKGEIPRDDEAADEWRAQPGFNPDQILFFGRKENFWEMADTGPCGPNSEIHLDRGAAYCNMEDSLGHECKVNGECERFLELWNLVFIQYNRLDPTTLELLPRKHVDTGMGFERLVSVLQDVDSNYKTDLLAPILDLIQELSAQGDEERETNITPYRVIADHGRAAAFLIADGVTPGNSGRNYVCRMIIRRASRFGSKIGLFEPFLAMIAEAVIDQYGEAFPQLVRSRESILNTITREEQRFHRTLESGMAQLENVIARLREAGGEVIPGAAAFDLQATYGLPLEITRDIARERGFGVDQPGFEQAMERHRIISGAGQVFGEMDGGEVAVYQRDLERLQKDGVLDRGAVRYDPYTSLELAAPVLVLYRDSERIDEAHPGDHIEVLLPQTCFYMEAGGQVSDTGSIVFRDGPGWEIRVNDVRQPTAGAIVHRGEVIKGNPRVGDQAVLMVDAKRRRDIMRNHTATHLLHAQLHAVLGEHARQAGSLVAPDRLRFDFTHSEGLTEGELEQIEAGVNRSILANYPLRIQFKPYQQAIQEGAIALFDEKYGDSVRTIAIGEPEPFSYELCGGTHVDRTGDIGLFLITGESSVGSGLRRIEAVTGDGAYQLARHHSEDLARIGELLNATPEQVLEKTSRLVEELDAARREAQALRQEVAEREFGEMLGAVPLVAGVPVLASTLTDASPATLRKMADRFRERHPSGVAVVASVENGRPILVAAVTDDLVQRGLHAGQLIKEVANRLGGDGGGRPTLAQAGGTDAAGLPEALAAVAKWVEQKLQPD